MKHIQRCLVPIALLLLGALLRFDGVARDSRLHGDESLFASLGRSMVHDGDWNLYEIPTDKPPTTFALVGLSTATIGESEMAVRLPNAFASLLSLALLYAIANRLMASEAASVALAWGVVAPLDIAYAPTAFQDPPMILCLLWGTWAVLRQRWGQGGLALGLAFAMKPTAIYLLPLVAGLGLLQQKKLCFHQVWRSIVAFSIPLILLILWDQSRLAQSFFELGSYNNNPGRFIRSDEVGSRLQAWGEQLGLFAANEFFFVLGTGLIFWGLLIGLRRRDDVGLLMWWSATFVVIYFAFHWLVAFPIYERYMLLLLPFVALLLAYGASCLMDRRLKWHYVLLAAILIFGFPPARKAIHYTDPKSGQDMDRVAALLEEEYQGQVVYDFALGWQIRWYLPSQPSVLLVYFPTPEDLALHMQYDEGLRYLLAPNTQEAQPWLSLLADYGIVMSQVVYDEGDTVLYALRPPSRSSSNTNSLSSEAENNPN